MSALEQGRKNIFAGVHIYKKIRELLQTLHQKENAHRTKEEGAMKTEQTLLCKYRWILGMLAPMLTS